jgi:hypothetical protein
MAAVVMIGCIVFMVGAFWIGIRLARRSVPAAVLEESWANGFASSLLFLPPTALVWLVLVVVTGLTWGDAFFLAIGLVTAPWLLAAVGMEQAHRDRAGALVLDLGQVRQRTALAFSAVWFPVAMVWYPQAAPVKAICGCIGLLYAWRLWSSRDSHLELRENGVWVYAALIRWDQIDSVEWDGTGPGLVTLLIRSRRRLPTMLSGRTGVPVDAALKPEADAAIRRRLYDPGS